MQLPSILLWISVASLLLLISSNWKPDQDSVAYLSMARSFAAGGGMLHLGLHQWHYAPLYSVVISPAFWFSGRPFLLISLINIATAWALVVGTFFWFQRYSPGGAGVIAALVGVNIGLWDVCREPRADTLFSALLIWAAALFAAAFHSKTFLRFCLFTAWGGLLTLAAVFTRQVGVFLTAGFTLTIFIQWWSGRAPFRRFLFSLMPGLLAAISVMTLIARDHRAAKLDRVPVVTTYTEQLRQENVGFGAQVLDGVRRQTADVGRLLIPGMWGSFAHFAQWLNVNTILYVMFTIPVAMGWWRLTRRTADPLLWTVPFYAAMFVVWPFDQGTRFNVPLLPVLWASVWTILNRWPRQRVALLKIVWGLHLLVSVCYLVGDNAKVARWNLTLPRMSRVAQSVNDPQPVAAIGAAPNDILIWRYLLDRPVSSYPQEFKLLPYEIGWVLQRRGVKAPDGFERVISVDDTELWHRN